MLRGSQSKELASGSRQRLAKLLSLLDGQRMRLVAGLFFLAAGSGVNLLFPEVIRRLLTPQWISLLTDSPAAVASGLIGLCALQAICFYYRSRIFTDIGQEAVVLLRRRLYAALVRQPVAFFDTQRTGDLVSRLGSDASLLQSALSYNLSVLIRYGFQVIVGLVLMVAISWRLAVAIVLLVPVLVVFSMLLGKRLRRLSRAQQDRLAEATTVAEETFSGARMIKAFCQEGAQIARYDGAIAALRAAGFRRAVLASFFSSFVSFLMNACIIAVLFVGIHFVTTANLSLGDLTAFLLYGVIVAVSFAFLAGTFGEFAQALGATDRIFELLEFHPERDGAAGDAEATLDLRAAPFEFSGVYFRYPSRPDVDVLRGIDLVIQAGSTVALVGPSGAGKSTMAQLLLRFYEPQRGEIRVAGRPFRELSLAAYRSRVAYVPQDAQVFAMSLLDNLRFARADVSEAEAHAVCNAAQLGDFVAGLPEGLATLVGERGTQLSGGQRQRLAIARALLRNPDLVILDEATSALDSENEALIQEALRRIMAGRTTVVIAHRLSTVKNADLIVVLNRGEVVQRGTHEELSRQPGLYRQLVERQELA